ncbi:P74 [Plodia interpunctella granulovirus]|uniref:p74 n=1 Tax=Plodia interpunctella granulovirus TaxID=262175 RepID=A0A1L5JH12_9BBAC|nr:P74 [Plodia interpunctella granulovirus]APO13936.1 P74 [Plodia interpunctella granulovirus]
MATPTPVDIVNAVHYLSSRDSLSYIQKWRNVFPHILIDYTIRWAENEDYYVPPALRHTSAVVVNLEFSKEGCESMSCFPYTETGVIDYLETPIGGYTQTSNTSVQYNQPACFNLDPAAAARNGEIQSVELRYTPQRQCVMVDTFTKMWMNSPFMRTSRHVVNGVDDVPGFDVENDSDPAFPEKINARFNEAYCRRFGRNEQNNSCSQPWYEVFVSFILGESVYTTFKLAANHVFAELRNYDYTKPSSVLPDAPIPRGRTMLEEWYVTRDRTVDDEIEQGFLQNKFFMADGEQIEYRANEGFKTGAVFKKNNDLVEQIIAKRLALLNKYTRIDRRTNKFTFPRRVQQRSSEEERDLETIITQFLEDHDLIFSILADLGFNVLESTITNMLKQLNKIVIPALRRMLLMQSRRFTAALLGETYKAAMMHALNRVLISTVTTVAKAAVRAISAAVSIINVALVFLTIADLVLMIWDPFGYSNMFPRGYLNDLSVAFLSAYYESIDAPTRDIIEFKPHHFVHFVIDEEEEYFVDNMIHLADYLVALDVNSNGQLLNLNEGIEIDDVDEKELLGASLAANDTWLYFKWYCSRHDALVTPNPHDLTFLVGLGFVGVIGGYIYYIENYSSLRFKEKLHIEILLFIIVVLCCLSILTPSMIYYNKLARHKIEHDVEVVPKN